MLSVIGILTRESLDSLLLEWQFDKDGERHHLHPTAVCVSKAGLLFFCFCISNTVTYKKRRESCPGRTRPDPVANRSKGSLVRVTGRDTDTPLRTKRVWRMLFNAYCDIGGDSYVNTGKKRKLDGKKTTIHAPKKAILPFRSGCPWWTFPCTLQKD